MDSWIQWVTLVKHRVFCFVFEKAFNVLGFAYLSEKYTFNEETDTKLFSRIMKILFVCFCCLFCLVYHETRRDRTRSRLVLMLTEYASETRHTEYASQTQHPV
uniref:Uncharacterized protein n=1 Tax=Cacopsylla melanoneura TaxID=428564 RepID=A0A8D9AQT2_9HEMI